MKKMLLGALVLCGAVACSNNGSTETKADSLKLKLDTTLNKLGDSIEAKGQRTMDTLQEKLKELRNRKDTVQDTVR